MAPVLLLFDIDGTLLKTGGAGMRAMGHVGRQLFGKAFTFDGIQVSGHLDPLIFAEAAALNGLGEDPGHHDAFRNRYLEQLQQELMLHRDQVRPAPGVRQVLDWFRDRAAQRRDVVLGLLTGNYTQAVPIKLSAVGIDPDWFVVTAFGDEAPSRADLVPVAMQKYHAIYRQSVCPSRVVVIGDTPRDVACAQAHGCVAFAVATGSFSRQELNRVGADVVVEDLSDPQPLIQLVDRFTT